MESIPFVENSRCGYALGLGAFVEVDHQLVVTGVGERGSLRFTALLADAVGRELTDLLPLPLELGRQSLHDAILKRDAICFVPVVDDRSAGTSECVEPDSIWACSEPMLSIDGHLAGIRVHLINVALDDHNAELDVDTHDEYIRFHERLALARRLHDGPRQLLSAAALRLTLLIDDQEEVGTIHAELQRISELVDEAREAMRVNPFELDPNEGDPEISTILHEVAERFSTTTTLHVTDTLPEIHPRLRRALSRTAREAVVNALKHSGGQNVHVILSGDDTEISFVVKDDGHGFDAATVLTTSAGIGLQLMGAQVTAVGGICQLSSSPGEGTTIRANLPLCSRNLDPCPPNPPG